VVQLLGISFILVFQHLQWFLFAVNLVDEGKHKRIQIQHIQDHDAKGEQKIKYKRVD